MATKSDLRHVSLSYRASLTDEQIQEKSSIAVSNLVSVIGQAPSIILSYLPLLARSEINVHGLEKQLPRSTVHYVEPRTNAQMPEAPFTHIIVPCVMADLSGHRLGYGRGWYDRFLLMQSDATTIGVCYEENIVKSIPHESHDVRLDYVITESRIIEPQVE